MEPAQREGEAHTQHQGVVYINATLQVSYLYFCLFLLQVTEEVQSILKLLRQLTESESSSPEPPRGTNRLDASLAQLQTVACKLALSHNKQVGQPPLR